MLKLTLYIFIFVTVTFSCRRGVADSEASAICNCFDQIHNESVRTDNEAELQEKTNTCAKMFSDKLASFGSDEEGKALFMEEFRACQEN